VPNWGIGVRRPTSPQISFLSANFQFSEASGAEKKIHTFEHVSHVSALAHCIFVCFALIATVA